MDVQDSMAHRLLRVVLVFHGEPLEERAFPQEELRWPGRRRPTTVTLGQEGHDTFAIPACPLPPSFPLLRAAGDEFVLRLSEGMVGQLCLSGETMSVQEFFSHRRGIAVSSPESEVSAAILREHVLGPSDWGIVATESTGAVAFFFQFLPPEQRDLRPRSAPPWSWLPGLPFQVDRFLLQGLALALALTGLVLGPSLWGWESDDSLALTSPLPQRLARLLPPEQTGVRDPPDRHAALQGLAEKMVAERRQPRDQDRRPLLSDDPAAQAQPPLQQQVPPPQPAPDEQPADAGTPPASDTAEGTQPATPEPPTPSPASAHIDQRELAAQDPSGVRVAPPDASSPPPQPDASSPSPQAAPPQAPLPQAPLPQADAPPQKDAPQPVVQAPPPPAPRRGPQVLSGAPASPGPLTRSQLDQTVSRHQDELTFCYRQELKRQPGLAGRLVVVWNVDATGTVSRVNISNSTLHNSALEACVAHAIQSWRFPAARGLTLGANVPLVFRD